MYRWSFFHGFVYVILSLSINWHNHSTSYSLRSFSGRPGFLLFKTVHRLNFWERLCTILFLLLGLFGKAFITFLSLLTSLPCWKMRTRQNSGLVFFRFIHAFSIGLFFSRCNLRPSSLAFLGLLFSSRLFCVFPQGFSFVIFLSMFFSIVSTFLCVWHWCHCLSVKVIS